MTELIKSLPPMLSGDALKSALSELPPYDKTIIYADTTSRLIALSDLYKVYVPTSMSVEIYSKLYLSLLHSLQKKNSKCAVMQANNNFRGMQGQAYTGIMGGTDSFTIIGASGIGKSTAVSRALSLVDSGVIETEYSKVCPCIVVQCPFDSSIKGLLFEVLRKVDEVLSSTYYEKAIKAHSTTDMLIGSVSQVALNHIGMLIVDEIQNVANSKNGKALVGVLTQLINNSGISIGMVGTPESSIFFEQAMQLARRSLGLKYETLSYDAYFKNLCQILWNYQYVKTAEPLTDTIISWLYEHSAGIISVVVSLIHDAQEMAILNGTDRLDLETLTLAYQDRLTLLHAYIQPVLEHGSKTTTPKKKKVASDLTEIVETTLSNAITITGIATVAKAQGLDVVDLIGESIAVIEVAI